MTLRKSNAVYTSKVVTTTYTAKAGELILADTSSAAFTLTLPLSPLAGDSIIVYDAANTFDTKNLTIGRNGSNINGAAADLTANAKGARVELIYFNVSLGWRVF